MDIAVLYAKEGYTKFAHDALTPDQESRLVSLLADSYNTMSAHRPLCMEAMALALPKINDMILDFPGFLCKYPAFTII